MRKVVLVMTVGLCDAIKEKALPIDEAAHYLFSPHTMRIFRNDKQVSRIIHRATEFDSIARLVPTAFDDAVADVRKRALAALKKTSPCDYQQAPWLDKFVNLSNKAKGKRR
jgi:hypothetical protein